MASHERVSGAGGAPNRVLGGASSGNVAAELAHSDMLGMLSRDEYATGLLQTAWLLLDQNNGYDLARRNLCWPT